ncbi:uncharacterized protein EV422DRAFT_288197 [Fimicolochytrium jonesii]|uniref:uncharacterized protein n=1 Tax=Fimicolochytrium jonesii TaxID=1396493 RepID=UPI0022FEB81A|nr:uncharacterized protein EV422DRAFT_288197 [Fimicolochytrium jonesii]KAI8816539.1 hypothetical protein EV422DRAFT_288197 [Fimicolochytrium jonesii]
MLGLAFEDCKSCLHDQEYLLNPDHEDDPALRLQIPSARPHGATTSPAHAESAAIDRFLAAASGPTSASVPSHLQCEAQAVLADESFTPHRKRKQRQADVGGGAQDSRHGELAMGDFARDLFPVDRQGFMAMYPHPPAGDVRGGQDCGEDARDQHDCGTPTHTHCDGDGDAKHAPDGEEEDVSDCLNAMTLADTTGDAHTRDKAPKAPTPKRGTPSEDAEQSAKSLKRSRKVGVGGEMGDGEFEVEELKRVWETMFDAWAIASRSYDGDEVEEPTIPPHLSKLFRYLYSLDVISPDAYARARTGIEEEVESGDDEYAVMKCVMTRAMSPIIGGLRRLVMNMGGGLRKGGRI